MFALVLMRLVIGWHFFGEGTEKVEYDRQEKRFRLVFSADKEFLDLAKGPRGRFIWPTRSAVTHGEKSCVTARKLSARQQNKLPNRLSGRRNTPSDGRTRKKSGLAVPVEFPPHAASQKWAAKVAEDWRTAVNRFSAIAGVTEAQKQHAKRHLPHDNLRQPSRPTFATPRAAGIQLGPLGRFSSRHTVAGSIPSPT